MLDRLDHDRHFDFQQIGVLMKPQFTWWDGGGGMLDQIICECDWKSQTYFDGQEYAYSEWKKHVSESHSENSKDVLQHG